MSEISILIVSSKLLLAECLKNSLYKSKEFTHITLAATFHEANNIINSQSLDIIILNDFSNTLSEKSFIQKIKRLQFPVKLIALNNSSDSFYMNKAIEVGIHSYITYNQSIHEFIQSVKYCYSGYNIIPHFGHSNTKFHLTEKEYEVLLLISNGRTNNEIARLLLVSKRTVEYHISSILKKFHVKSRVEAVAEALKKNLIS